MFSVQQKRDIADAVQAVLRATNHPELPTGEIQFSLHVDGAESWSWADIQNNGAVTAPGVNPWNEKQVRPQPTREGDEGIAMGYILEREMAAFSAEVEAEAAILIRDGYAAPFDAIDLARENVKMRRRRAAESRPVPDPPAGAAR